jgi:uncharacterized spore protein YtfJ
MNHSWDKATDAAARNQKEGMQTLDKLFAVTQPGAVYSEPVHAEGQTVITLSEVVVGMGFGYGIGEGGGPNPQGAAETTVSAETSNPAMAGGAGGGGGGGGFSSGRPVAIVSISANGVQVRPVVDVTKLGIAAVTTLGAMALMLGRMNGASRK